MINHTIIIIFSVLTVETIFYFNFFNKLKICLSLIKKIPNVILFKKASDHWQEKSLLKYSQLLLLNSIKLLGILLVVFIFFLLITFLYKPSSIYLISYIGFIESAFIILLYASIRRIIVKK